MTKKALLGKKIGMTQVFQGDRLIPVTVVEAGPCLVTGVRTKEQSGYSAVQLGFAEIKPKHLNKPKEGFFKKNKFEPKRHLIEYRIEQPNVEPGQILTCDIFSTGEKTQVTSVSKGKGFQGVIKRWNFSGGPGGHGSHFHRAPGSVGMAATPSRVFKGTKLPGQMGNKKVSVQGLEVIEVNKEQNILLLKGALPGSKGSLILISSEGEIIKHKETMPEVQAPSKKEQRQEAKEEQKEEKTEGAKVEPQNQEPAKIEAKGAAQVEETKKEAKEEASK